MPDFGLKTLNGLLPYSYIIYKVGSTYIAYNVTLNYEQFSSTSAGTLFTSVADAMNTAGGGFAYIRNGLYLIDSAILIEHFCGFEGEDMEKTILRSTTNAADNSVFRYWQGESSTLLERAVIRNFKIEIHNLNGNSTGESNTSWMSSGTKNCLVEKVWVKSFSTPTTAWIGMFFDTANNTNNNQGLIVMDCRFEGPCGGEDMFGCGNMISCLMSFNRFFNLTSQAIGVGATQRSIYNYNYFENTGNAVGFENLCEHNEVCYNHCYNTTGIKLSQEGSTATNISRSNKCCNNKIEYGMGGIEAGISTSDEICDNYFYRTERNGLRGSFHRVKARRNIFEDTNFGNYSHNVNAVAASTGGIICFNNTTPLPLNDYNDFGDNIFINTGTTWTDPVSSTTKSGFLGGIILDTNYRYTHLGNLNAQNLSGATVVNHASAANKLLSGGFEVNAEDKLFYVNEQVLKMKGSDNNPFTVLDSTGQTLPNQAFDFFAQYTKQASATNVVFTFGYNSDIASLEWWSKWSGSNKRYFSIDANNDSINLDGNIKIADNLIEIQKMGTDPAGNPPTDNVWMYVRNSDEHVVIENDAGTIVDIQAGGGGGAPTDAQYLTLATNGSLSAERTLAAGVGLRAVDGGANNPLTLSYSPVEAAKQWIAYESDFINANESNNLVPYDDTVSGTGATVGNIASTSTEMGIVQVQLGTVSTNRAAISPGTTNLNSVILGAGTLYYIIKLKINNLSTSGERYALRFGFIDSVTAESSNGVYFIYEEAQSANWRIIARNGGSGTAVSSGSTVDTNYNVLKIIINAAGTSASFYLNGTLLTTNNTISSGLPTGTTSFGFYAQKSVGSTNRTFNIDWLGVYQELTTARAI